MIRITKKNDYEDYLQQGISLIIVHNKLVKHSEDF